MKRGAKEFLRNFNDDYCALAGFFYETNLLVPHNPMHGPWKSPSAWKTLKDLVSKVHDHLSEVEFRVLWKKYLSVRAS